VPLTRDCRVFGLDGCPGGWVVARGDVDLRVVTFSLVADCEVRAFLGQLEGTRAVVAIDVPIGLAEGEPRACDRAARRRLGARRQSSVFSAPCRGTLAASDYLEACAINRGLRGRAISRQTWGILSKIAAVEAVLEQLPGVVDQVWEVHPEVTFAELAGTPDGLRAAKKSADGQAERLALLAAHGLTLDVEEIRGELKTLKVFELDLATHAQVEKGQLHVRRDDIVDAAACLVTARRIALGEAVFLPAGAAPRDARGRRMQIGA